MSDSVIVALITGGVTLLGTIITVVLSHRQTIATLEKNSEVSDEKIKGRIDVLQADLRTLSNRVDAHNRVVERTYNLERRADVIDEKIAQIERSGHHE